MATNNKVKARGEKARAKQDGKIAKLLTDFDKCKPAGEEHRTHYIGSGQEFTKQTEK